MTGSSTDQWHLAALLDGEPGPDGFEAAIAAVERDPGLRERFERGLIIGQVLRGEAAMPMARRVSPGVTAALAAEPVVLRPKRGQSFRSASASHRQRVNRPAAALAIAASLLAVAVLVGPGLLGEYQNGQGGEPPPGAPAMAEATPASERGPAVAGAVEAGVEPIVPDPRIVERWTMDEPAGTTALDALLVDHRERASASALTGFIPYAAVVGRSGLR
jgi:negative regulator of sigma E activity